ncbi:MAG: MFS transporter [Bradyrhizobium sp.]|nr:MAG: MFS transporter [Bradyrhizobium sp.]
MLRLLPLVLGAFAIGAETFMVSGVLPQISSDLHVTTAAAGSLVTIFALAYAFGSPLIAVATAGVERKRLLIFAIGAFALANLLAAVAPSFEALAAARALLALTAGSFMPAAVAFAAALFTAEHRGRAIATIYGGMTAATVVGVPAGVYLASLASWRAPFFGVAVLAALAAVGVATLLPSQPGVRAAGFGERIAVARRPAVLQMLTLTTLALIGPFAINTFFGVLAEQALGIGGDKLALVLAFFGIVSFAGSQFGGFAADHWPRERFLLIVFIVLIAAFPLMSLGPMLGGVAGAALLFIGLGFWGLFGWAFPIVQQARLVSLDPAMAPITLSLNISALYIGVAIGASLGAGVIARWSLDALGLVAGASEILALAWLLLTGARKPADEATQCPSAGDAPRFAAGE